MLKKWWAEAVAEEKLSEKLHDKAVAEEKKKSKSYKSGDEARKDDKPTVKQRRLDGVYV